MRHNNMFDTSDLIYFKALTSIVHNLFPIVIKLFNHFVIVVNELKVNILNRLRNFQIKSTFPI